MQVVRCVPKIANRAVKFLIPASRMDGNRRGKWNKRDLVTEMYSRVFVGRTSDA